MRASIPAVAFLALIACRSSTTEPAAEKHWIAVSAGNAGACGLDDGGAAYCWALAASGASYGMVPTRVATDLRFNSISAGNNYVCALTAEGAAYCWGANAFGQLGNGTTTSTSTPTAVSGGRAYASISAGTGHTCAITTVGAGYCWGDNSFGQLGVGTTTASSVPAPVSGGLAFLGLSAGHAHTCGYLVSSRMAYCWGSNANGQIGDGSATTPRLTPTPVAGALQFASISAGVAHSCGVSITNALYCWGSNALGQSGSGFSADMRVPNLVAGVSNFYTVSAAGNHTCALTTTGAAYCWGTNGFGQLGGGGQPGSPSPVVVAGGLQFRSIDTGLYLYSDEIFNANTAAHTCGVTIAGAIYCWGANNVGQLGSGTTTGAGTFAPTRLAAPH